jgi:hypothetical protein
MALPTATRLKAPLVLNTAEVNAVPAPEGKPRITLRIRLPGDTRDVIADADLTTQPRTAKPKQAP